MIVQQYPVGSMASLPNEKQSINYQSYLNSQKLLKHGSLLFLLRYNEYNLCFEMLFIHCTTYSTLVEFIL